MAKHLNIDFFNLCVEITDDFDFKNTVNKLKNYKKHKMNMFGLLWSPAVIRAFHSSALCGVLIKTVDLIIPWIWSHVMLDLFHGLEA